MVTISPEFLAGKTLRQRQALSEDPDFLEACLADGLTPSDVVGITDQPQKRTEVCESPVVLDRINVDTGELSEMVLPCNSANSLKCPSCAEHNQRLRQRQIMNGLEAPTTKVAFFTNTAPSFGKTHRSSFTVKDAFKARHLHSHNRIANRLTVMKKKGKCPCGSYHDYEDALVGTPLDPASYGYADEVIWSENLPRLMKSLTRKLRKLADTHGIRSTNQYGVDADGNRVLVAPSQLSLYTVYERQKRGSLHAHMLIVVDDAPDGFDALVADIQQNWKTEHNPTAQIPQNRLDFYRSDLAQKRWYQFAPARQFHKGFDLGSVPLVNWKGGDLRPGTEFGTVWDIRILAQEQSGDGEISGHQQAAGYLAKYLTKNQSALSVMAIDRQPLPMRLHLGAMRQATLALTGDRVCAESLLASVSTEIENLEEEIQVMHADEPVSPKSSPLLARLWDLERHRAMLADDVQNIKPSPVLDALFHQGYARHVTSSMISEIFSDERTLRASRGLAIRLSKALDNGGFTGSLTSVSNWATSLADLRAEMQNFVTGGAVSAEEFEYVLNTDRMRELAGDRLVFARRRPPSSDAVDIVQRVLGVPSG